MPNSVPASENLLIYDGFIRAASATEKKTSNDLSSLQSSLWNLVPPSLSSRVSWGSVQIQAPYPAQPKQIHSLAPN